MNERTSKVKQAIRRRNLEKYDLENPFYEAQFLDAKFGPTKINEAFNIEALLFEEKMKELNEEHDFETLFGYKVPKTEIELQEYLETYNN